MADRENNKIETELIGSSERPQPGSSNSLPGSISVFSTIRAGGAAEADRTQAGSPPLISDRFEVKKELGRGGMGVTYLAIDTHNNGRPVVIKVLLDLPDSTDNKWIEIHFRREMKALSHLDHPRIVKLVASGEMTDGKSYIAMEYVDGYTLRSQMQYENGLGDFDRIAHIIRELGEAISAAHDKGIYHRDLKPENIMLYKDESAGDDSEHVKVIDFGISTVKDSLDEKTRSTALAGSIRYMAPEQLRGKPSASSDIYAMGIIAYEMLTSRSPFNIDAKISYQAMQMLAQMQRAGVKVKPKDLRPSLPDGAQEIILKALAYDPAERYRRADQFGNELAHALTSAEEAGVNEEEEGPSPTRLELATVLFMDIVGYSKLPIDLQMQYMQQLQSLVRSAQAFRRAQSADQLISLPTGDGMVLAFFGDPAAAVQCAVEVARGLKQHPKIGLRMGINTGPVYHVEDINANRNITGGGINIARRVMECGNAGHILLSQNVADILSQFSEWQPHLHDLGMQRVEPDVPVHLFNFYTEGVGNPELPEQLHSTAGIPEENAQSIKQPAAAQEARAKPRGLKKAIPLIVAAVALIAAVAFFIWRGAAVNTAKDGGIKGVESKLRTISYWGELQLYRNGRPFGAATRLTGGVAGETYFNSGDGIRFFISSSDDGYLYLINEEQRAGAAGSNYTILFPSSEANNGSSEVRADQQVATSELVFDGKAGTEKTWIIWSANQIIELENAFRRWGNPEDRGDIKDAATVEFLRNLLERSGANRPQVEHDEANERMNVIGRGDVLVYTLRLKHR